MFIRLPGVLVSVWLSFGFTINKIPGPSRNHMGCAAFLNMRQDLILHPFLPRKVLACSSLSRQFSQLHRRL